MARWLLVIAFTAISIFGSVPCRCCAWSARAIATDSVDAPAARSEGACPKCRASRDAVSESSPEQSSKALWTCEDHGAGRGCQCQPLGLGEIAISATSSVDRVFEFVSIDRHFGSGVSALLVSAMQSSSETAGCTLHIIRPWVFDPLVVCHRLRR